MKKKRLSKALSLLFFVQILAIPYILRHITINESGIYTKISNFINVSFRILFGKIPFSVGDIFYTLIGLYFLFIFINWIRNLKKQSLLFFLKLTSIISVLYFCFYLFWGFNYAKEPLYKHLKLEMTPVNSENLISLTTKLIQKTNDLQLQLAKADSLKVSVPYSKSTLLKEASMSYSNLSKKWIFLSYKHPSIKLSTYSLPLTYMGYAGYYNPFSAEAQVNSYMPKPSMAFTACHEIAHQIGYAPEQEANFIGYLACIYSDDAFVQYSGYLVALSYALNNLRQHDALAYKKLTATIHEGVLKNYKESYDFWAAHKNPTTPIFESVYDRFLKVNKQKEGIKSYSQVVTLMVAYHKKYPLKKS